MHDNKTNCMIYDKSGFIFQYLCYQYTLLIFSFIIYFAELFYEYLSILLYVYIYIILSFSHNRRKHIKNN